ncbi:hypothetical protein OIV83_000292 [Microbotryomycetes sp. JL201]|nr:hypothetical protein OIV83_000292 [Microbotryomycetes sp. JL201]
MAKPFSIDSITGSRGTSVGVLEYGCTLYSLKVKLANEERDLVIGLDNPANHKDSGRGRCFFNQVVGRYANRLPAGQIAFGRQSGGAQGTLHLSGDDKGVCLHGGKQGFDTVMWQRLPSVSECQLFSSKDSSDSDKCQYFIHTQPAGTDGFPGTLLTEIRVALDEKQDSPARIKLVMRARLLNDEQTDVAVGCPVNLTWHVGYNLANFAQNDDVKSHKLFMNADRTPELDDRMLPTGKLLKIQAGHDLDFYSRGTRGRTIGERFPTGGVDHNFVFARVDDEHPQVVLTAPDDAISLSFRTNQSSVQCYTAGGFDSTAYPRKRVHDPQGRGAYAQYGAVFLEFQHPVATVLHPDLCKAAGTDTILRHDEVYENWVEIEINVAE